MESSRLDDLLNTVRDVEVTRAKKRPDGWEPLVLSEAGGYITTEPSATPPTDWTDFLSQLLPDGMNVSDYEVDDTNVEMRAWDGNIGNGETRRFYYFKAKIRRKTLAFERRNIDDIIALARKTRTRKLSVDSDRAYWVHLTDFQAGQADGDGVAGMVHRLDELADIVRADLEALKQAKKPVAEIFVPITGDLVEGIDGWYAMQRFSVQLDRRDQVKLVRRLVTEFLLQLAETNLPVRVAVVPGNHGENRLDGKAFTSLNDNDDVAVIEQIAEAFAIAKVKNVSFVIPQRDRIHLTTEVQGWIVGLTHGHVARGGSSPEQKILNWFERMAVSRDSIGSSDILFTGHYHSGKWSQLVGDTDWIQGGTLSDTSAWFSQAAGLASDPCVLRGTITRTQKLESVMPHRWPRSKPETREIA